MAEKSAILVGRKPPMKYVSALLMQLSESQDVTVKARGRLIKNAVDVVELAKRLNRNLKVKDIKIGSEERFDESTGTVKHVSFIEIKVEA
jgi:DNA-binding protein Alba